LTASDLKKGVSTLATDRFNRAVRRTAGTVVGVINAFTGIASTGSGGIGAVSAGIAEALVENRARTVRRDSRRCGSTTTCTSRLEYFNVEMDNSSSELVDYFIKKTP
jgi:biopolymer transport protein ExbB/biopolymer transport protein TolQ